MEKVKAVGVPAVLAISMYIAFQIFADVLSTKIAFIPLINLAVDGGTIIYPLTFTVRDIVHKTLGKKIARNVVIIAGILNVLMVALFWIIGMLPADSTWGLQGAYESILMPVARITFASIMAEIVSELIDTEIFSKIYKKAKGKYEVLAVLGSNFVALLFDSVIFGVVAFFGALPIEVVGQIIIANILIKGAVSIITSPIIKLIPRTVEFDKM